MVPMFGVDGDLSRGAKWDLIVAHVVTDIDDRECATGGGPGFRLNEGWCGCQLTGRNCIDDSPHLGLEYATRYRFERNLGIITRIDPLQGVLLECCAKLPILVPRIDEKHRGAKLCCDGGHARSQGDLCHETRTCRTRCRLIEIELSVGEFCAQLRNSSINAFDI